MRRYLETFASAPNRSLESNDDLTTIFQNVHSVYTAFS